MLSKVFGKFLFDRHNYTGQSNSIFLGEFCVAVDINPFKKSFLVLSCWRDYSSDCSFSLNNGMCCSSLRLFVFIFRFGSFMLLLMAIARYLSLYKFAEATEWCWRFETVIRSFETLDFRTWDHFWPYWFQVQCLKHSACVAWKFIAKQSQIGEATLLFHCFSVYLKLQLLLLLYFSERFLSLVPM